MEILSPAGSLEKLKYAIYYGADAVYAGGKDFGLRAQSKNFSNEELRQATQFCHQNNKKIYLTVNIFAHNCDVMPLISYLKYLQSIEVDAIIVSDPAVFSLAQEHIPSMPIHISTQANVTSWKSVQFWQKLGAKRIILARELTFAEICEIKQKVPTIELEMFVHGAMCMAYSGRCLLSAFLNGRDANQGECSQPCRWEYGLIEKSRPQHTFSIEEDQFGTYLLNSKDLCLSRQMKSIFESGMDSIKIEGRMKSIYYTANVTRVYHQIRKALINKLPISEKLHQELEKISHRVYAEGFFHDFDAVSKQYYESSAYIRSFQYLGNVINQKDAGVLVEVKSKFSVGEEVEFIFPNIEDDFVLRISKLFDENKEHIEATKPNTIVFIPLEKLVPDHGILRKKII